MSSTFFILASLTVIWVIFFIASRETRREMLVMSLLMLAATPGAVYLAAAEPRASQVITDLSVPNENFLFAFTIGGIAAVIYHIVYRKTFRKVPASKRTPATPAAAHWLALMVIIGSAWFLAAIIMTFAFGLNPLHALIIGGIMIGLYIVADRKDLLTDAVVSAVFMAVIIFAAEQLFFFRFYPGLESTTYLGAVPFEEIAWAAVLGFTFGPLYEYARNLHFK